jgi:enoyl-CoA hydratase
MAKAYTERVVAMSTVDFETIGSLAIVTINRAHTRNAIDRPTAEGLADGFRRFDRDDSLEVAILTGAGGRFDQPIG